MRMGMDTKEGRWLLRRGEERLRDLLVPLVPRGVETYHLTNSTTVWMLGVIIFSFLARKDIRWLWGVSLMVLLQYVTDLLDGEIGRQRKTGLVRWGFYMDHLLDYLFLCSIMIGYAILLPASYHLTILFVFALVTGFMVNSFLSFHATGSFRIAYLGLGPTEIRLLFIIVNTLLILFGKTYISLALPYVLLFALCGLALVVATTQRLIWKLDKPKLRKNQ